MMYRLEPREEEPVYTRIVAAQLAEVSAEFLERLESEELIHVRRTRSGREGYSLSDVRLLARVWRMRRELAWDVPALKAAPRLRRRVLDLISRMDQMEQRMQQREQELLQEVEELRKRVWSSRE